MWYFSPPCCGGRSREERYEDDQRAQEKILELLRKDIDETYDALGDLPGALGEEESFQGIQGPQHTPLEASEINERRRRFEECETHRTTLRDIEEVHFGSVEALEAALAGMVSWMADQQKFVKERRAAGNC